MKLIDLEDAKAAIRAKFKSLEDRVEINMVLNEQTIIDAIPVEWMREKMRLADDVGDLDSADLIRWMIHTWAKERRGGSCRM